MYQYPYGNAQQLNLDWILSKIQELEAGAFEVDIEEVANTLIAASFDAGVSYRRYDYCFYNGKLYRAVNDTSGTFNPADWLEVVIGDDIPVLTRLLNAVDTSLTTLQGQVADLDSDDVDNASNVTGTTVTNALNTLNTAVNLGTLLDGLPHTEHAIPTSSDLDNYTTSGTYYVNSDADAATIQNMPRAASGTLYVIRRATGNYFTQIYLPTTNPPLIYARYGTGLTWSAWELLALDKDIIAEQNARINADNDLQTAINNVATVNNSTKLIKFNNGFFIWVSDLGYNSVVGNSYTDVPVTFPQTFTNVWTVFVTMRSDSTGAVYGGISLALLAGSVTQTGCTVRIYNYSDSTRSPAPLILVVGTTT